MANIKIAFVGGGSAAWGPGLISNILRNPYLDGCHLVLHDIDAEALRLNLALGLRYRDALGSTSRLEATTDQSEALDGASYVLVTISTGGFATMRADLEVPEKYGIYQTVGDTTGPGGLSRTLRNVPVFLQLAHAMEARCPKAWMLNLSNPLSTLTRVVNKETAIRALGICHGVPHKVALYARFFGVTPADCAYVNTGIDHCAWFTQFLVQGRDARELLLQRGLDEWLARPPAQAQSDEVFAPLYECRCGLLLGRQLGALPAIGDRHLVEFFPTFLQGLENVERYGLVRTTIADRARNAATARAHIARMVSGEHKLEILDPIDVLGVRQADNVAGWIAALDGGPPIEDNLNAPNCGQIPELPPGAVVETRGILDGTGLRPIVSPMPKEIRAIVLPHVLRQELAVEAAVEGSFAKALAALMSDPQVGRPELARALLEELISANQEWLPQFQRG